MSLRYFLKGFCLILTILALSSSSICAEDVQFYGEINAKDINLRADATTTAEILSILDKGRRVEVVLKQYDWYKIRLPKSLPVYIKKNLVDCIKYTVNQPSTAAEPVINRCLSAKVLADRVNIRAKPSESAPIVGIADKNEIVNVISESGGWYKIEPIQNSFGWVYNKFVSKAPPSVTSQSSQAPRNKISSPEIPDNFIVLTGIVMPYGVVFMRQATHKLVTADNKIFLLKGNRASLNALNRQKAKVIGSIISPAKSKYPVVEIKIIEAA